MLQPFICSKPVCVDLDGTLIKGHSVWQIKSKACFSPLTWLPPRWPLVKHKIVERAVFSAKNFQYYLPLLNHLYELKNKGVPLYLVTGSPLKIAQSVAEYLNIFDRVWASSPRLNLVGQKKADFLLKQFGPFQFNYVGDHQKDWHVWKWARHIFIVRSAAPRTITYVQNKKKYFQDLTLI